MSLKIAVIGLGHMGKIHLNKLITFKEIEVSAVVDVEMACAKELSLFSHAMAPSSLHQRRHTIPLGELFWKQGNMFLWKNPLP